MPLDTNMPPWLAQQFGPKPSSPWLLDAMRLGMQRQEMQAKLPLEIQQMQLQQKQTQLAIDHQGLVNDEFNEEMGRERADQETYKQALSTANQRPDGSLGMGNPGFASKKYQDLWHQRMLADSQTTTGKMLLQDQLDKVKELGQLRTQGFKVGEAISVGPDGQLLIDDQKLSELHDQARQRKQEELMDLWDVRTGWHGARDPVAQASKLADLKAELRASQLKIVGQAGNLPGMQYLQEPVDINAEYAKQWQLQDQISTIEKSMAGRGFGGYQPDPTEKRAMALERARMRVRAAEEGGNEQEIEDARMNLQALEQFQASEHRNPEAMAELDILKSQIKAIDRLLVNPTNKQLYGKDLQAQRDLLQKQLSDWEVHRQALQDREPLNPSPGTNAPSALVTPAIVPAPAAGTNAPPPLRRMTYQNGHFVEIK